MNDSLLVGIDLGGTKIEGIVIDAFEPNRVHLRRRKPTESWLGYSHVLEQIGGLVKEMRAVVGSDFPAEIGVGTPGTLDSASLRLRGSNTTCLNGQLIVQDLEKHLGANVFMGNDANCFALAESIVGSARGYDTVFGVILGTGCGGGYVVNGQVLSGRHGIAGEWGQVVIEPGGEISPHGTHGTVEAYISGAALEAFYARQAECSRSLQEIADRPSEDAAARATITRLQDYFVRSLPAVINTFDPHAIVIGGGVGNLAVLYSEETRLRIAERVFAPDFQTPILKPHLGDSAGVFGAALLTRPSRLTRSER